MAKDNFSSLPISSAQVKNLDSLGYKKMTPIQAQSLPHVLKGRDLIAQAKTGSGKTAAFGIGLLEQINPRFFGVQALVLCPTRELADQVGKELRSWLAVRPISSWCCCVEANHSDHKRVPCNMARILLSVHRGVFRIICAKKH